MKVKAVKLQAIIARARAARKAEPEGAKPFPPGWEERFTYEELERLAIMTIDAGLSETQALEALGLV